MEINKIIKFLKDQSQKTMRKNGGQFEPKLYFVLLYPGQKTPVYYPIPCELFMDSDFLKDRMYIYVQACWLKKKATSPAGIQLLAVCLVSDAWIATGSLKSGQTADEALASIRKDNPNYSVSKDPRRQEILLFNVCYPSKAFMHCIPYKRKGKNIEFLDELDSGGIPGATGRLAMLYPATI